MLTAAYDIIPGTLGQTDECMVLQTWELPTFPLLPGSYRRS